jgi:ABC-type lipoprotein release transport system permease subunit
MRSAMLNIIKMAFRDLGRNRRRSFFSALALGLGLVLLLFMAGVIQWEIRDSTDKTIRLQSGHLQVRAKTYNEDKTSLAWSDLIADPEAVAAQIATLAPVEVATPRLYASGIVVSGDASLGVRIIGIDPASPANAPFRDGMVSGQFISASDTSGVLIGKTLADKMGLKDGDSTTLLVNTSNGSVDQQTFTIRGIYSTGTPGYDESTVFLPMAKAQAFSQAGNHASTIYILLKDRAQTSAVVAALQTSQYQVLTFEDMNPLIVLIDTYANSFMIVLYLIVLAVTATVIVNTLVMSVFERTREIGILAAVGMKSSSIMAMFFVESCFLAFGGIIFGLVLGAPLISWIGGIGIPIGNMGITGLLFGDRIYAILTVQDSITLSLLALIVSLVAALYPALLAARMEPVEALHSSQ